MTPRTIRLRRPPVLSIQEGVFVPDASPETLNEIENRWNKLCELNPAYFDGRLYHVLGVHRNGHGGCVLHVIDCAYRYFAVQERGLELGVRALGLKGVVQRADEFLMGLRSHQVAAYRDMWEFAPSGSMEPGRSPEDVIIRELREETALEAAGDPNAVAVLFDPVLRCWEVAYRLTVHEGEIRARAVEYANLKWRNSNDLPENLSPIARQIAQMLRLL
jgi:ADP-ribose pyrophosphatase YjhB (NUDIX family)